METIKVLATFRPCLDTRFYGSRHKIALDMTGQVLYRISTILRESRVFGISILRCHFEWANLANRHLCRSWTCWVVSRSEFNCNYKHVQYFSTVSRYFAFLVYHQKSETRHDKVGYFTKES
jgi:hypothetical protein